MHEHIVSLIDTISFAISSRSRIGETSISPALRQAAPVGSVDVKQVAHRPPLRPETSQRHNEISTVTRAQAFQTAAKNLAAASKRLEDESKRQAQYWEQMAVLRTNGWPLSRLPSNDRALVLHFACGESGPQYQSKGVAMLRQEDSGNLILPGQVDIRQQKVLSVTVRRKGVVTGRSVCKPQSEAMRLQVEADLTRAKESLFQEELFNETAREARLVANMGVKTRSSHVEIELPSDCVVDIGYEVDSFDSIQEQGGDQCLAEYFATGLRMMLIAEYEHKYSLRSKYPPQPLTSAPRPPAEYAILRPLLTQIRHEATISPIFKRLDSYRTALARAGLSFSYEQIETANSQIQDADALQALRRLVSSTVLLKLPTEHNVSIRVETYLGSPLFGTSFLSTTYTNVCGNISFAQTSSTEDVISFVEDVLAQESATVVLELSEPSSNWLCKSQFPLEFEFETAESEGKHGHVKILCSEGGVSISYRGLSGDVRTALYHHNFSRVSSIGGGHEATGLPLQELLQQWSKE